jgi:hypothetical protein
MVGINGVWRTAPGCAHVNADGTAAAAASALRSGDTAPDGSTPSATSRSTSLARESAGDRSAAVPAAAIPRE